MSTRKLILTALLCGLAILVAGAVQLVRISGHDARPLPTLGTTASVGGLEVTAERVSLDGVLVTAVVQVEAAGELVGFDDGWSLVGPEGPVDRHVVVDGDPPPCASLDPITGTVRCRLGFELDQPISDLRGYVLLFGRGSDRASWAAGL